MNKLKQIIAIVVTFACLGGVANASLIDLGIKTLSSPLGGGGSEAAFIQMDQSLSGGLTYLNKFEYGKGWTGGGALGSSYFTVSPTSGEVANATVSWDLTGTGFQLSYVLLKNGTSGGFHLYHLYGVAAGSGLIGSGSVTINGLKGISHVSFFGTQGTAGVPEGGATIALLGIAMAGLCLGRRFMEC